ncbi:hypothetical protein [Pseudoxanthomonas suwonensis]|uniref:Uncharacterized protein n=1 Tax=Pseudoxanthomonas suwonensis TaxID=314722 RepID=A0A0E3Z240_9GAMM|nr:hypothetical protein [Pseudoxanthomonas suwonensis]AKC87047.1 hypothetical protein WQ53_10125 [Pseudoxanthomonas suwonensis]
MRLLTALFSCVLSLFGCDTRPTTTSITRIVDSGSETLFSKTTLVDGVATFECFASASGGCHYRIYEERCDAAAAAATTGAASACRQQTLDAFDLTVGKRHRVEGLPAGFRHCVAAQDAASQDAARCA